MRVSRRMRRWIGRVLVLFCLLSLPVYLFPFLQSKWIQFSARGTLEWITIHGGEFDMGNDMSVEELSNVIEGPFSVFSFFENERPRHRVRVPSFMILRTEVTVAQYEKCVRAGACRATASHPRCNASAPGKENHPVNCVNFLKAVDFCRWVGGRLPSEAEWEYAASSGGNVGPYPWGKDAPTCENAVIDDGSRDCLPKHETRPVCSTQSGNTKHGLCDMAGNIWEWVEDWYHDSFIGAPGDGSAWLTQDPRYPLRVLKGGGIQSTNDFRISQRVFHPMDWDYRGSGVRCVKSD